MSRPLGDIVEALGGARHGSPDLLIHRLAPVATAGPGVQGQAGVPITWTSSWTDVSQSPKLIELTLELGNSWTIPRTVRRVVVVPSGSLIAAPAAGP